VGTTKNTDNNSSYDNNNEEPEHLHDITTSTKSTRIVKMENASLEEKFRQEIDALMEEDIAFLMKFTSSWAGVLGGEQPTSTPSLL
jgi:hypothetical protein